MQFFTSILGFSTYGGNAIGGDDLLTTAPTPPVYPGVMPLGYVALGRFPLGGGAAILASESDGPARRFFVRRFRQGMIRRPRYRPPIL